VGALVDGQGARAVRGPAAGGGVRAGRDAGSEVAVMLDPNFPPPIVVRHPGYQALMRTGIARLDVDRSAHVKRLLRSVGIAIHSSAVANDEQVLEAYRRLHEAVAAAAD
jgi:sulfur carrier protein ThiS